MTCSILYGYAQGFVCSVLLSSVCFCIRITFALSLAQISMMKNKKPLYSCGMHSIPVRAGCGQGGVKSVRRKMAEREGFEPSVHFNGVHSLSRRAPSALLGHLSVIPCSAARACSSSPQKHFFLLSVGCRFRYRARHIFIFKTIQ